MRSAFLAALAVAALPALAQDASTPTPAAPATAPTPAAASPAAAPAPQRTLAQREQMAAADQRYQTESLQGISETCGTEITARIDWSRHTTADFESNNSLYGWCEAPLDALRSVCGSDLGKDAVKASIKEVVCIRGDVRAISLADGVLTYTVSFDSSNDADFATEWLKNNL